MAHNIVGVIGQRSVVALLADRAGDPPLTELPKGLAIAPLGERQIDAITEFRPGSYAPGFVYLSDALHRFLSAMSVDGPLVYIETEYFGGTGSQAAAMFAGGSVVTQHAVAEGHAFQRDDPINSALRAIGVIADSPLDEFDSIELARYRSLEDLGLHHD